jgi:cytochrome c-type biogenesis protein CcmE
MTEVEHLAPRAKFATRRRLAIAVAIVAASFGFLVFRGLGDATMYFRTADEAAAQRETLGERRFRLEGRVVPGSVVERAGGIEFNLTSAGVQLPVVHQGDPPELFQDDIPVVLEGRFAGAVYESDRIMVRHTSEYRKEHPERVEGAPVPEDQE